MRVPLKTVAPHIYLAAFILVLIPSCTPLSFARTPEEARATMDCLSPSDELPWEQVDRQFGRPDEAPIPAPGSLFQNVRIYKDKIIIFYVDKKETIEAGRPIFIEVVKKIEVCKER